MRQICIRNLIGSRGAIPLNGVLIASLLAAGSLAGCVQTPEPTPEELEAAEPRYNSSGSVILEGRPMDLDPAVRFATDEMDMAVVNIATPRPFEREYELRSVTDERGWLMIRTPADTPLSVWDQDIERLVGHAKLGRFGDPEAELELLRRLNRRMETLAGGGASAP